MLSFAFRRYFASIPKLSNWKSVRDVSVAKLKREEIKELTKQYNLGEWTYGAHHDESHEHDDDCVGKKHAKTHHLSKTFVFNDWKQAFTFMDTASGIIDQIDHHPDWKHVDNEVDIRLSTHDAGNNVSIKDIILARTMDHIANQLKDHNPESALNPSPLDVNSLASGAFHEETIEKEREISKAAKEDRWVRRVSDWVDEVPHKSSQNEIEAKKKPTDKHGDSSPTGRQAEHSAAEMDFSHDSKHEEI